MDGAGSWNVALYGGGGGARDKTIINRIMLRFRPIAPKPAVGASVPGGSVPGNMSKALLAGKRTKRKYVRVRRNSGYRRKNRSKSSEELEKKDNLENTVVTLQLLPEKIDTAEGSVAGGSWCKNVDLDVTVEKLEIPNNPKISPSLSNTAAEKTINGGNRPDRTAEVEIVETWVTVESVTDTCMDVRGLGCTDVDMVKKLKSDTCPGFISDGFIRVNWVNEAYKRMVSNQREGNWPEIRVWLKTKKEDILYFHQAFTCGVRLQYTWQNEKCTKMVPCDVWRMECGGLAWRLDIKAALSLGL